MPALTAPELARYRTHPHASNAYLYPFVPATIFAARVNNPSIAVGATTVVYDSVSAGAYTAIEGGETLWIGTAPNTHDIGVTRVRSATSAHLIVAWDSDIVWADNLYLTVKREFLLWRKAQNIVAGVVYKDYDVAFTDQTLKWPPAALMNEAIIKLFRPGDPNPELYIADGGSYALAPGATLSGHAWSMPGGTPSSSASATPGLVEVSAPMQDYWKHVVADSNGKSSTTREPVVVVDPANCYTHFICESLENIIDGGMAARFRVFGDAPVSAFPERCSIFYFSEDFYGASAGEHIKFFGYITERSVKKDPETGDVTFAAVSVGGMADKIPVRAGLLQDATTPANWEQGKNVTVRRSLFYLAYFHSTLFEVANVQLADDPTPDKNPDLPEGSLWGLLTSLARTWRGLRCGVTKRGRVVIGVDPQLRAVADRGAVAEVMQLTDGDWHEQIDVPINDFPVNDFLDASGIYYDGVPANSALPVLAIAPGHPEKEYGDPDAVTYMRLNGQPEANQMAGLMLGQRNNPYGQFKIAMTGNWWEAFEPALQEYIRAPLAGWATKAGALLADARLIVRGMSQAIDENAVQQTTLTVEVESFPEQGVTGDYPPPFEPPCEECDIPCVDCEPSEPVLPTVDFSGTPLSGCVPLSVEFTPIVDGGTAVGYLWDFGDGEFSTEAEPTHVYAAAGTYTVTLGVDFLEGDYVEETKVDYVETEFCTEPSSEDIDVWAFYYNEDLYRLLSALSGGGSAVSKTAQLAAGMPTEDVQAVAAADSQRVNVVSFGATNITMGHSSDNGATWAEQDTGIANEDGEVLQIASDRTNRDLVWAINDFGNTTDAHKDALASQVSLSGVFGPLSGAAYTSWFTDGKPLYLWVSTDGGATWDSVRLDWLMQILPSRLMNVGNNYSGVSYTDNCVDAPDYTRTPHDPACDVFFGPDRGVTQQNDSTFWLTYWPDNDFAIEDNVWGYGGTLTTLAGGLYVDVTDTGAPEVLGYQALNGLFDPPARGDLVYFVPGGSAFLCPRHDGAGAYVVTSILWFQDTITKNKSFDGGGGPLTEYVWPLAYWWGPAFPNSNKTNYIYKIESDLSYSRKSYVSWGISQAVSDPTDDDVVFTIDFDGELVRYSWSTNTIVSKTLPVDFAGNETGVFVTSQGTILVGEGNGNIHRSTDRGDNWTTADVSALTSYPDFYSGITEYGGSPGQIGVIVLASSDNDGTFLFSVDDGVTWARTGDVSSHDYPASMSAR